MKYGKLLCLASTVCIGLLQAEERDVFEEIDVSTGGRYPRAVSLHRRQLANWLKDDYDSWSNHVASLKPISLERPKIVRLVWGDTGRSLQFTNLVPGISYDYSVVKDDGTLLKGSFVCEPTPPRTLSVPDGNGDFIRNVRDLGGWRLENGHGRMSRYGVLYRGAALDSVARGKLEEARSVLVGEMRLRTELDLRGGYEKHAVFNAARLTNYQKVELWVGVSSTKTNELRKAFAVLGDRKNYPVYFHCAIGRDRTGLLGFMINALCGVEQEAIYRDFLTSCFGGVGLEVSSWRIDRELIGDLRSEKWGTVAQREKYGTSLAGLARAYLEWCGVPASDMTVVTEMLTGETLNEVLSRVNGALQSEE